MARKGATIESDWKSEIPVAELDRIVKIAQDPFVEFYVRGESTGLRIGAISKARDFAYWALIPGNASGSFDWKSFHVDELTGRLKKKELLGTKKDTVATLQVSYHALKSGEMELVISTPSKSISIPLGERYMQGNKNHPATLFGNDAKEMTEKIKSLTGAISDIDIEDMQKICTTLSMLDEILVISLHDRVVSFTSSIEDSRETSAIAEGRSRRKTSATFDATLYLDFKFVKAAIGYMAAATSKVTWYMGKHIPSLIEDSDALFVIAPRVEDSEGGGEEEELKDEDVEDLEIEPEEEES